MFIGLVLKPLFIVCVLFTNGSRNAQSRLVIATNIWLVLLIRSLCFHLCFQNASPSVNQYHCSIGISNTYFDWQILMNIFISHSHNGSILLCVKMQGFCLFNIIMNFNVKYFYCDIAHRLYSTLVLGR